VALCFCCVSWQRGIRSSGVQASRVCLLQMSLSVVCWWTLQGDFKIDFSNIVSFYSGFSTNFPTLLGKLPSPRRISQELYGARGSRTPNKRKRSATLRVGCRQTLITNQIGVCLDLHPTRVVETNEKEKSIPTHRDAFFVTVAMCAKNGYDFLHRSL